MSQDTWEVIKILGGIVLATIIGTMVVVALIRPSDDTLATTTNSVVTKCRATEASVVSRSWMGLRWTVRCQDGKHYVCSEADIVNCAEK